MALNLTAESESELRRVKQVNTVVTSGYTRSVAHYDNGKIDGKIPKQLRIAEVNNTGAPPKTWYVNASWTREYYLNNLDATEFTDEYWNTSRNMTAEEVRYITEMDKDGGNTTYYNTSK